VETVQGKNHISKATNDNSATEAGQSKNKIASATHGGSTSLPNSTVVVDIESNKEKVSATQGGSTSFPILVFCHYPCNVCGVGCFPIMTLIQPCVKTKE
jgi:hypothetical protein